MLPENGGHPKWEAPNRDMQKLLEIRKKQVRFYVVKAREALREIKLL